MRVGTGTKSSVSCILAALAAACGSSHMSGFGVTDRPDGSGSTVAAGPDSGSPARTDGEDASFASQGDATPGAACTSAATSISGTIYDPVGKNPLYNVVAYVPSTTPSALPQGASCASCDALYSGNPVATALTDASGHFALTGVPAGPR